MGQLLLEENIAWAEFTIEIQQIHIAIIAWIEFTIEIQKIYSAIIAWGNYLVVEILHWAIIAIGKYCVRRIAIGIQQIHIAILHGDNLLQKYSIFIVQLLLVENITWGNYCMRKILRGVNLLQRYSRFIVQLLHGWQLLL